MKTIITLTGNPYTEEGKLYYLQDPMNDHWVLHAGVERKEDGTYTYTEMTLDHKPTFLELVKLVTDPFFEEMEDEIEYGLTYTTLDEKKVKRTVHLTLDNMLEWGMSYLMAKNSEGSHFPQSIFLGKDASDEYLYTFTTMRQMAHFFLTCNRHVSNAKAKYWERRERIDWKAYDPKELEGYEENSTEEMKAKVGS